MVKIKGHEKIKSTNTIQKRRKWWSRRRGRKMRK
jgi:hypothetical protein